MILVIYTAVEGARGNLEAERIENRENPTDIKGVSDQSRSYSINVCFVVQCTGGNGRSERSPSNLCRSSSNTDVQGLACNHLYFFEDDLEMKSLQ